MKFASIIKYVKKKFIHLCIYSFRDFISASRISCKYCRIFVNLEMDGRSIDMKSLIKYFKYDKEYTENKKKTIHFM